MGEELDRLFGWLVEHPGWQAQITHEFDGEQCEFGIHLERDGTGFGEWKRYWREERRLMKAYAYDLVSRMIADAEKRDELTGRGVSRGTG